MVKVISIKGVRNVENEELSPDGHWVELVFANDYGRQKLEMNGRGLLPSDPELREAIEFMLWDYGLLEQQDSRTAAQRVAVAQHLFNRDRNHVLAREYMSRMGAPVH